MVFIALIIWYYAFLLYFQTLTDQSLAFIPPDFSNYILISKITQQDLIELPNAKLRKLENNGENVVNEGALRKREKGYGNKITANTNQKDGDYDLVNNKTNKIVQSKYKLDGQKADIFSNLDYRNTLFLKGVNLETVKQLLAKRTDVADLLKWNGRRRKNVSTNLNVFQTENPNDSKQNKFFDKLPNNKYNRGPNKDHLFERKDKSPVPLTPNYFKKNIRQGRNKINYSSEPAIANAFHSTKDRALNELSPEILRKSKKTDLNVNNRKKTNKKDSVTIQTLLNPSKTERNAQRNNVWPITNLSPNDKTNENAASGDSESVIIDLNGDFIQSASRYKKELSGRSDSESPKVRNDPLKLIVMTLGGLSLATMFVLFGTCIAYQSSETDRSKDYENLYEYSFKKPNIFIRITQVFRNFFTLFRRVYNSKKSSRSARKVRKSNTQFNKTERKNSIPMSKIHSYETRKMQKQSNANDFSKITVPKSLPMLHKLQPHQKHQLFKDISVPSEQIETSSESVSEKLPSLPTVSSSSLTEDPSEVSKP